MSPGAKGNEPASTVLRFPVFISTRLTTSQTSCKVSFYCPETNLNTYTCEHTQTHVHTCEHRDMLTCHTTTCTGQVYMCTLRWARMLTHAHAHMIHAAVYSHVCTHPHTCRCLETSLISFFRYIRKHPCCTSTHRNDDVS